MSVLSFGTRPPFALTWHRNPLRRALIAGGAWSAMLTAGLTAQAFAQCGAACIDTAIHTAALSALAGIVLIGPLAAFGRSRGRSRMMY